MFLNCYALSKLDLSSFDTSKVTTMTWMFSGATNLQTVYV
ncbi:MAG TPA: BspA family leucine-rich repeat surface protein [Candidatus Coprosoma intestinipullorum]|uniref:BspA family leucine-rich repeat surface protein n=1 Tax=Candidatus Coprosoma intestinipullorum TaxID=2840752 RepID=A0A9D0ZRJ7_9FIRM|nr:BspA family leucine-rich repeat surface protein [Candidatus Coprosoma intestinipullorum]